jgi:RNA polymerase sigma factor (sigma-70 family)
MTNFTCVQSFGEQRAALIEKIPSLRAFFTIRVKSDDVDDMLQDVALRVHVCRRDDAILNGRAYLFQVARSVITDRRRRAVSHGRDRQEQLAPDHDLVEERCPERILLGKQRLAEVMRLLQLQPERTREIFRLHRLEHASYGEIADRLGISVSAVEKHVMRASRHLAAHLADA